MLVELATLRSYICILTTFVLVSADIGPYCTKIRTLHKSENPPKRQVSVHGVSQKVLVLWGAHETSKAVAALLTAVIRHQYGFINISMEPGPTTICEMAELYSNESNEVVIHVGAEWHRKKSCNTPLACNSETVCGAAGKRLKVIGPAIAPTSMAIHVILSNQSANLSECNDASKWSFFMRNVTKLQICSFLSIHQSSSTLELIISKEAHTKAGNKTISKVKSDLKFLLGDEVGINLTVLNRVHLSSRIKKGSESFLLFDYELWDDITHLGNNVIRRFDGLQPSPREPTALFLIDSQKLTQFAPKILNFARQIHVFPKHIRSILETGNSEEAACAFALANNDSLPRDDATDILWIAIYLCKDDLDVSEYKKLVGMLTETIKEFYFELELNLALSDNCTCSDQNHLSLLLDALQTHMKWQRVVGIVGAGHGTPAAAIKAKTMETPLVTYDVPPNTTLLNDNTYAIVAGVRWLGRTVANFLSHQSWRRVAIVSERSKIAEEFSEELIAQQGFNFKEVKPASIDSKTIKTDLIYLRDNNARIIIVNTNATGAVTTLCAACELGMTPEFGYAWLVREWSEWRSQSCPCSGMHHFTVSYSWRGGNASVLPLTGRHNIMLNRLSKMWANRTWPPLAASLVDSILLLVHQTDFLLAADPSLRYDFHKKTNRNIAFSQGASVNGTLQWLRLKNYMRDEQLVFVHAWDAPSQSEPARPPSLLHVWAINQSSDTIKEITYVEEAYAEQARPSDLLNKYECITNKFGDSFVPGCYDAMWSCAFVVILLVVVTLYLARRWRLARQANYERELHIKVLARNKVIAATLTPLLIDRSKIELREVLGEGHFGRVHLALVHQSRRQPWLVAAKALLNDASPAEEAEFLSEASTLASLRHTHIVKLEGVVAADGHLPLLLMEHAEFGDLLHYLHSRAHLSQEDPEACHVAPKELTRLAREAAMALDFLAKRRLVHRDVRAANCLVDGHRSLKLADFGMARRTARKEENLTKTTQEDYEYQCRRRGMFPVPWMAPESLASGVFSAASDVWALGVLALELATLGARPFGAWQPVRVFQHVRAGGHAPLPLDASRKTREVTELCWRYEAESRATASEVAAFLADHVAALEPALLRGSPHPSLDGDSGFAERPYNYKQSDWNFDPHISTL